jgi:hypothetical protein
MKKNSVTQYINILLDALFEVIDECSTISFSETDSEESEKKLNYKEFLKIKTTLEAIPHSLTKFSQFFKPSLFLRFAMDNKGRIPSQQFYNFILRKISLDQARIDLAKYDSDCDGYLTESDLQSYISGTPPPNTPRHAPITDTRPTNLHLFPKILHLHSCS